MVRITPTTATPAPAPWTTAIVTTVTTAAVAAIIPTGRTRGTLYLETITTIDRTIFTRHKWNNGSTATGSADGFILLATRGMRTRRLRATTSCSTVWASTGRIG